MTDDREGHCASCGAPLADDQRWCLECGARRAGLVAPGSLRAAAPAAAGPERTQRDRASLTFLAVVACLLVALALGVVIGRSRDVPAVAKQPAPREVITVSVPAAAGTAPAAAADTATAPAPAPTTTTTPSPAATTEETPPPKTTTTAPDEPDVPQGDKDDPIGDGTDATEIG